MLIMSTRVSDAIISNLRIYRTVRGMKQSQLGQLLDVSATYIGMIERLTTKPSKETGKRIEDIFNGKSIDFLLSEFELKGTITNEI